MLNRCNPVDRDQKNGFRLLVLSCMIGGLQCAACLVLLAQGEALETPPARVLVGTEEEPAR